MSALLGPAEIRDLATLLDIQPTKKLGQNFVIDANTVRRIVKAAQVVAGETVVEVGPGLGSLTLGLLETGAAVVAVEIDRRMAAQLPITVSQLQPEATLTVITADALKVTKLPNDPHVFVANLPYNVSVPVLLHFLEHFDSLDRGLVMVQAEVGNRVAAGPGSKVYGSPSIKAAWYGEFATAGMVSRQVFWPVPNVDSVLVRFERREQPGSIAERTATFALVDAAFQQRRKMLRQALSAVLGGSAAASGRLIAAGIAPTARGEELTVHDFLAIVRAGSGSILADDSAVNTVNTERIVNTDSIPSDRDVLDATGRHPDEWFAFLDIAGAAKWTHEQIVGWFATNADHLGDDWVESLSVRYEAARGLTPPR